MTQAHFYDEFPSKVTNLNPLNFCFSPYRKTVIVNLSNQNRVTSCWQDVFEAACDFAREWGGLLWEDSKRMRLVVKSEVHNQMREFLHTQIK